MTVEYFIIAGVILWIALAARGWWRERKKKQQQAAKRQAITREAVEDSGEYWPISDYETPPTTLDNIYDKLSDIELLLERIKSEITQFGVIVVVIGLVLLYFKLH